MMSFTEEKFDTPIFFNEYTKGLFRLNVGEFTNTLILSREEILNSDNKIEAIDDISTEHLDLLLKTNPEIVLIGTGKKQTLPPIEVMNYLAKHGKNLDFMDSNTACKTYNLLANENRSIGCIIII